jgi:hypothetical protein
LEQKEKRRHDFDSSYLEHVACIQAPKEDNRQFMIIDVPYAHFEGEG